MHCNHALIRTLHIKISSYYPAQKAAWEFFQSTHAGVLTERALHGSSPPLEVQNARVKTKPDPGNSPVQHTLPNPQTPCVSEPITRFLDANRLPSFKQASPFWSQRAGTCFALPAIALESCRMPLRSRGIVSSLNTAITQARSRFQPVNQLRYNHFPGLHCPSLRQRDCYKRTVERPQDKKNAWQRSGIKNSS